MVRRLQFTIIAALALLGALPPTLAHDDGGHMANPVEVEAFPLPPTVELHGMNSSVALPQSYFAQPEGSGLLTAHIVLMVIAWFFILPIGKISIPANQVDRTQLIITRRGHAEHYSISSGFAVPAFFLERERARVTVGENISCEGTGALRGQDAQSIGLGVERGNAFTMRHWGSSDVRFCRRIGEECLGRRNSGVHSHICRGHGAASGDAWPE